MNNTTLQFTIDTADKSAILNTIVYLHSLLPEYRSEDLVLMDQDYRAGDPYANHQPGESA
jgi:hypothetical protein